MNITKLEKIEKNTRKSFGQKVLNNLNLIDDESLQQMRPAVLEEGISRGIFQQPEIEAAQSLYKDLINEGASHEDAITQTLEIVKSEGFNLSESDIIPLRS